MKIYLAVIEQRLGEGLYTNLLYAAKSQESLNNQLEQYVEQYVEQHCAEGQEQSNDGETITYFDPIEVDEIPD